MSDQDPELERLLSAEREAYDHYERLRGYPADVQATALSVLHEAKEAVRTYRAKKP